MMMEVEYPSELIEQLQISLRKEAGIPNYNPDELTIPSSSSCIGRLDPSCPPYLRCNQCGGRLLRGIQSIVCIYCGGAHASPDPPDPIPFNSTFAYRSLLQSLHLTGSEPIEANQGNAITLSHLFNIHLTFPTIHPPHIPNNPPDVPLNLAGVDLDHFFTEVPSVDNSSGWEPHFQSALNSTPLPFPDASQSDSWIENDQSHASNIDSSTQTLKLKHPTHDLNNLFPTNNNLFQDDLWLSNTVKHTEDESFDAWQDFTSSGNASHPFPSSSNPTNILQTSTGKSLPSLSNDVQDDFDSLMAPNLFLGTTNGHNGSTSVNDVQEGSYSDRLGEMISGDLKSTENTNRNVDNTAADNTAETLMAQMNDLSFMLEGDLSVPDKQKENGVDFKL